MKNYFLLLIIMVFGITNIFAQKPAKTYLNPEIISGTLVKKTKPLKLIKEPPFDGHIVKGLKPGYHKKNDWIMNTINNPDAIGIPDNALQKSYNTITTKSIVNSYDGIPTQPVDPADNALDVGPDHVIQMTNGPGGAVYQVRDKVGNVLKNTSSFDALTGIGGKGDPIVLYDQFADRWLMSEFAEVGNALIIAISTTPDPLGTWYVYKYDTPNFPDYPKYAVWGNAYVITTNETNPTVYALEREALQNGIQKNGVRFPVPSYGTISFQALAPIDVDGDLNPSAAQKPLVMRMADDAWDTILESDRLEIFEMDIDFDNTESSTLTQILNLPTAAFDTELCGFTNFSCITQKGSTIKLDPLREIIMNRPQYRQFDNHESIVACHITDVNNNDQSGIRWYELRRTTSKWFIYQQGTYAPDGDHRWMPSIAINANGSIGLAYNVSGDNMYPSIRYTGRTVCDPLGQMTAAETSIREGSAANESNRYGDYTTLSVDPIDGSFWYTAQYNPTERWTTRVAQFSILDNCIPSISFLDSNYNISESEADTDLDCRQYRDIPFTITLSEAISSDISVEIMEGGNTNSPSDYTLINNNLTISAGQTAATGYIRIIDDGSIETNEEIVLSYTYNTSDTDIVPGNYYQTMTINIEDDEVEPSAKKGAATVVINEGFDNGTLNTFYTSNSSGTELFQVSDNNTITSDAFIVFSPPVSNPAAYINDDDCDCDLNTVSLDSPLVSLENAVSAELTFNYFYEDNEWQGFKETGKVYISKDAGQSYTLLLNLAGDDSQWQDETIDISEYIGESEIIIRFEYSDNEGWMYGLVIDDIILTKYAAPAVQTMANASSEEYLGPYSTVHYYDPSSGLIIASLTNDTAHDYGCTTVYVDREGIESEPVTTDNESEYITSKTININPTNPNKDEILLTTLYYSKSEIEGWATSTTNDIQDAKIISAEGTSLAGISPSNAENYTITYPSTTMTSYFEDSALTAELSGMAQGVALGVEPSDEELCAELTAVVTVTPTILSGLSNISTIIRVSVINDASTTGTIRVSLPLDPRHTLTYDNTLTQVGFNQVNNVDWRYVGDNGLFHIFESDKVITGLSHSTFGFVGTFNPSGADGKTTFTVTIVPNTGGDCIPENNSDSEFIDFFKG